MGVLSLILTLLVASLGAFVFVKLKIPAGAFLGAMLFVIIYNLLTDAAFIPREGILFIRIFAGALLGSRMNKSDVIQMKTIIFPAVLLVLGMLVCNLSLGYGIHRLAGMDLMTALLGSAPGGLQDIAIIAEDLDAEAAQVVLLQTVRLLAVLGIYPLFIRAFMKLRHRTAAGPEAQAAKADPADFAAAATGLTGGDSAPRVKLSFNEGVRTAALPFARTMVFAAIGGFLLNMTPLPAGALVGAMLATVLSTLFIRPAYAPQKVRPVVMTCVGGLVGSGIASDDLIRLVDIIIPACILVIVLLAANFVFGLLIHKITKLDLATSLFGSAAGGLPDMALIADEMGADSPKVAVLHLLRMICVVTLFPSAMKLFSALA